MTSALCNPICAAFSTSGPRLCLAVASCTRLAALALFPVFLCSFYGRVSGGRCVSCARSHCLRSLCNRCMQHFPFHLEKLLPMLPSHQQFGDEWVTRATQVVLRPQSRSAIHQSKKTRLVSSESERDGNEHTHRQVHLSLIELCFLTVLQRNREVC